MIELKNISKSHSINNISQKILENISLNIESDDFISIIGKSGSGKSTLLNIISCIDKFDTGELIINRTNISNYSDDELSEFRNRNVSIVFQSFNLISYLTIIENVSLPLVYQKISKKERDSLAKKIMEEVGLKGKEKSYPYMLSGGEKQRVAIARALINNPKVLIADEPTGSLDSLNSENIMSLFHNINSKGIAIILVTHDQKVAQKSKKIYRLSDGHLSKKSI